MNTAGLSYLGAKAKPTAEAIARWCEREGLGYEFLPAKGRHPRVRLTLNRRSRMVIFLGSPSDSRVIENVLQNVRKEARFLGWEPRKETPMEAPVVKSLADLPKLAEPASEPHSVIIRYEHPEKKPDAPSGCPRPRGRSHQDPDYQSACKKRNEWVFQRFEDGWSIDKIYEAVIAAGWEAKSAQNMYAYATFHRQEAGLSGKGRRKQAPKHIPLNTFRPEPERVEHTAMPAIDPLVLAITEAIAPLIRDQLANQRKDMESLKAKADKWDAISGLVREA